MTLARSHAPASDLLSRLGIAGRLAAVGQRGNAIGVRDIAVSAHAYGVTPDSGRQLVPIGRGHRSLAGYCALVRWSGLLPARIAPLVDAAALGGARG